MPEQIEIPADVARAFARDLRRYHATKSGDKRTLIAARQMEALSRHRPVTLSEVREMFRAMKDQV